MTASAARLSVPAMLTYTNQSSAAPLGQAPDDDPPDPLAPLAPRPPAAPAVLARGLRCSYGAREALRGIDLEIPHGQIFALLGPNGAGKTTTIEILEGFRRRSGGEALVLGVDPSTGGRDWRARIGVVLQESRPEAELTVRECLALYAGYYERPRSTDETIALVGLADLAGRRCQQLSGGEQRRLDVALALIGDPELVFLDEPTTGFDPAARRAAWDVIRGLRGLGKTIVLTTHYMEEAERLADHIAVMAAGEIVATGTPQSLGTRELLRAEITFTLPPGMTISDLPASFEAPAPDASGVVRAAPDDVLAALFVLTRWGVERQIALGDLEVRRPSLEDVYLQLTNPKGASRR
jgi:ABC-2 type transport system ATP-binding protein